MAFTLDNFVRSVLSADLSSSATTILLSTAAAPFRNPPDPDGGAPGILVLQDAPTSPTKIEVVTYTGQSITGSVVTLTGVTRAQESTTAQTWTAGDPVFQGITAGVINDLSGTVIADGALTIAKTNGLQAALDAKQAKVLAVINDGTAARTLAATDLGAYIRMTRSSSNTVTAPANSSVALSTGFQVSVRNAGSGTTTIVADSGVTINKPSTLVLAAKGAVTLIKVDTDTWDLIGLTT